MCLFLNIINPKWTINVDFSIHFSVLSRKSSINCLCPKILVAVLLFQVFETLETNKKFLGLRICNKIGKAIKLKTMFSYYSYQIIHTNRAQYSGSCKFEPIVV